MSEPQASPNDIRVPGSDKTYDRRKMLIVLLVPLMMALVQVSSVNNALPALGAALDATDAHLQWVLSGYALAIGIVLVPAGRLGDVLGRSSMFVIGLTIFTISSLAVGLAPNPLVLNILRIVQGAGAGMFFPQISGLIIEYFAGHARAKAFSLMGLVISMSVAVGPVMSGALIGWFGDDIGWRSGFIINVPLGVLGVVLAFKWLPFGKERRTIGPHHDEAQHEYEEREEAAGRHASRKKGKLDLDPVGALVFAIAILAIMIPFMTSASGWIWALLPAGMGLMVAWYVWEKRYKARGHFPMVDLHLFSIRTFTYSTLTAAMLFLGATSVMVVLAIFLQDGIGVSALEVGLIMLPNAILSGYASIWSGKRAVDHGRGVQVFCIVLVLLSILGMTAVVWGMEHGLSYWWMIAPTLLLGWGFGAFGAANQTTAMMDVPHAHGGTAGGIIQAGQRIATAVGTAIVTAVFFFGQTARGGLRDWYFGISLAFILASILTIVALGVSFLFWREGYHDRHPKKIRPAHKVLTEPGQSHSAEQSRSEGGDSHVQI